MTPWEPRRQDVQRFTEGDCMILARRLWKLLPDWRPHGFDFGDGRPDCHVFLVSPDGKRALDVEGLHDVQTFCAIWARECSEPDGLEVVVMSKAQLREWCELCAFGRYSVERARVIADRLVQHFGLV